MKESERKQEACCCLDRRHRRCRRRLLAAAVTCANLRCHPGAGASPGAPRMASTAASPDPPPTARGRRCRCCPWSTQTCLTSRYKCRTAVRRRARGRLCPTPTLRGSSARLGGVWEGWPQRAALCQLRRSAACCRALPAPHLHAVCPTAHPTRKTQAAKLRPAAPCCVPPFFRYLLNLDGISASYRLATLLAINSLVLKQASPWAEWCALPAFGCMPPRRSLLCAGCMHACSPQHRPLPSPGALPSPALCRYHAALRPCVHYLPFWVEGEADLLLLLRALRSPANQAVAQRLAAHGWAFAAAHLSQDAVYAYWQGVLDRYVQVGALGGCWAGGAVPRRLPPLRRGLQQAPGARCTPPTTACPFHTPTCSCTAAPPTPRAQPRRWRGQRRWARRPRHTAPRWRPSAGRRGAPCAGMWAGTRRKRW